jgi:hypothetical protein
VRRLPAGRQPRQHRFPMKEWCAANPHG